MAQITKNSKRRSLFLWVVAAVAVVGLGILTAAIYHKSQHHLVYSVTDIVISNGCSGDGSSGIVIHPNGSGYFLEGQELSCLGGAPSPGKRYDFSPGYFDYNGLKRLISAAQNVPAQDCVVDESFLEVRLGQFDDGNLSCYGSDSNNSPAPNADVQKLNNLADAAYAAQSKAFSAAHID